MFSGEIQTTQQELLAELGWLNVENKKLRMMLGNAVTKLAEYERQLGLAPDQLDAEEGKDGLDVAAIVAASEKRARKDRRRLEREKKAAEAA